MSGPWPCKKKLYPKGLFPLGHLELVRTLNNLGFVFQARGELARSQSFCEQALAMQQRLAESFSELASEAEALNFFAALPPTRDFYLGLTAQQGHDAGRVYTHLGPSKGTLLRALVQRRFLLQQAHDGDTARLLQQWLESRQHLAQLTLSPLGKDADPRERQRQLDDCSQRKEKLERQLAQRLPQLQTREDPPHPRDLCKQLPADAVLLDLFRYRPYDPKASKWLGYHYAAFVLSKDRLICRVELGDAEPIETALKQWQQALAAQGRQTDDTPSSAATQQQADRAAAQLRRLLWQPLSAHVSSARQVWVCPDGPLAALPFAALPGSKPDTLLLHEHTFAVLPHPFALLEWLSRPAKDSSRQLLLVGDVDYGSPGKPWKPLPASGRERDELARLAQEQARLRVTTLGGTEADSQSVLEQLRQSRTAHLATHGYFAAGDSRERERLYQQADLGRTGLGERVGAAVRNPLTLSGLVLAGANRGKGEGLLTAEALAGEDLHGLELAVLSACQTGLGEAAAGEGVFGLQRALHLAGARNVVASLWRVDDEATAALMVLFYRNLWQHKLAPAEALRQAQLTLYRHPESVKGLAQARGPDFDQEYERVAKGQAEKAEPAVAVKKGSRLGAKFWAGFVLSGPGR